MFSLQGLRIGQVRGIPIRLHPTLLLVLPFIALGFAAAFRGAAAAAEIPPEAIVGSPFLWGLLVAVTLFASILVHELAHALYAQLKGGRVRGITLLMIGGVSELSDRPARARDEAVMALVGPLVSVALGGLFLALQLVVPASAFSLRFALFYLSALNLFLGLFNLLPAFPMDGGRVLRAALTPRLGLLGATRTAAWLGKAFAILFAIAGFFSMNFMLLIIAMFIYLGADGEARSTEAQELLGKLSVAEVMGRPATISPAQRISEVAEVMLRERALALIVHWPGGVPRVLTLRQVERVPEERRPVTSAGDLAVEAPVLAPTDDLARAVSVMGEARTDSAPVMSGSELVGQLTLADIARAVELGRLARAAPTRRWSFGRREDATV